MQVARATSRRAVALPRARRRACGRSNAGRGLAPIRRPSRQALWRPRSTLIQVNRIEIRIKKIILAVFFDLEMFE